MLMLPLLCLYPASQNTTGFWELIFWGFISVVFGNNDKLTVPNNLSPLGGGYKLFINQYYID
ncbi:hypothetical protein NSTC745_05910 [Nostoc sp. DSM 114161]